MRVGLIAKRGPAAAGTARYSEGLRRGLAEAGLDVCLEHPELPSSRLVGLGRRAGVDLEAFFSSYPLRARPGPADLYHLTSQTLATLLLWQRWSRPVVVTVLDILPYLLRRDPRLRLLRHPLDEAFYRMALAALRRASALVAISEHTKKTLVDALGLPPDRIDVTPLGVEHARFRPTSVPAGFRSQHGLAPELKHLLYVGSNDPRKDLPTLVRGFARLRAERADTRLLVVGGAPFREEQRELEALIGRLGVAEDVRFVRGASDDELVLFYNAASLVVMPSPHEGFGLPALEAMACGAPLVYARAGPLPEIVGDTGVAFQPGDDGDLVAAAGRLLDDAAARERLGQAARDRAAGFTWARTAELTRCVYERLV
ncbi:MAG TPA: glycosyltransferase family 1 protein [Chloroflexota bacterium]|nr:glycosyltransferase family 1 protein [Chloroflexota bacterium]